MYSDGSAPSSGISGGEWHENPFLCCCAFLSSVCLCASAADAGASFPAEEARRWCGWTGVASKEIHAAIAALGAGGSPIVCEVQGYSDELGGGTATEWIPLVGPGGIMGADLDVSKVKSVQFRMTFSVPDDNSVDDSFTGSFFESPVFEDFSLSFQYAPAWLEPLEGVAVR